MLPALTLTHAPLLSVFLSIAVTLSGIGQMIATGFVRNGATVYISSRDQKAIEATAAELTKIGPGKCIGLATDLGKHASAQQLIDDLKSKHGVTKIHVLINNSGNSWGEPLGKFSEQGWSKVMDLNVKALFFLTQAAIPLLQAAATQDDPARIINIGSVAGVRPQSVPTWSYDVSQHTAISNHGHNNNNAKAFVS